MRYDVTLYSCLFFFFKQKTAYEIGVTGVQTCALPIYYKKYIKCIDWTAYKEVIGNLFNEIGVGYLGYYMTISI